MLAEDKSARQSTSLGLRRKLSLSPTSALQCGLVQEKPQRAPRAPRKICVCEISPHMLQLIRPRHCATARLAFNGDWRSQRNVLLVPAGAFSSGRGGFHLDPPRRALPAGTDSSLRYPARAVSPYGDHLRLAIPVAAPGGGGRNVL